MLFCCHYNSMLTPINTTMHRSAFCQFSLRCIYYWRNSSISTVKETGKTHLCAMFRDQFLCLTKVSVTKVSFSRLVFGHQCFFWFNLRCSTVCCLTNCALCRSFSVDVTILECKSDGSLENSVGECMYVSNYFLIIHLCTWTLV